MTDINEVRVDHERAHAASKDIFVSYARRDIDKVHEVVEGLRLLGKDVWLDESLVGGQAWWDSILAQIRGCGVFVQAISPTSTRSEACTIERKYAADLGKPILPVFLEELPTTLLPPDLAVLQYVDYRHATEQRAFRLAAALTDLPGAPPLPEPLPDPPPVPVSYLASLAERLRAPELSRDEQAALVARLRGPAENPEEHPEEHEGAVRLLKQMQSRGDLFHAVALEIKQSLEIVSRAAADAAAGEEAAAERAAAERAAAERAAAAAAAADAAAADAAAADKAAADKAAADKAAAEKDAADKAAADAAAARDAAGRLGADSAPVGDRVEVELNKWNWGAFLLGPIWGIGNGVFRSLLTFIPFYGIYEWIMLGRKGNRWAWERRHWDSIESFRKTQRKWATWAVVVDVLLVIIIAASSSSGS